MVLTEVIGHKMRTLGKMRAIISLGRRKIKYTIYIVKDDFSIEYEGILRIDFLLGKHRAKCDLEKGHVRIDEVTLKLHPCKRITLTPCSETIVRVTTNKNRIGIVNFEETTRNIY